MRVVILVGGLPPLYNGGTEIATVSIAKFAAKAGHEVHVIAADGSRRGAKSYKEQEDGFKVHRIPTVPPPYWHGLSFTPFGVAKIMKLKPDIIHAQAIYMALCAYVASTATKIPYMIYGRGGIYIDWFMKKPTVRILMGRAYRLIAQTEDMRKEMKKYVNREMEIIPNGVDTERFNKLSRKEARTKLGFPQDKKIVLSVGRCRPEKNIGNFVRAAKADESDTVYVSVGDGEQLDKLKEIAGSRVIFTGSINNKDVPTYLSSADVLVNTSLSEGFPVSLLEGMGSGLPIVAPNVCGIPEIITDGVNGILTKPDDYMSTADAVERILGDRGLADKMAEANKRKAKLYTWEKVIEKLYG